MKIEIKPRLTGATLFEGDFSSVAEAFLDGLKRGVNLEYAHVVGRARTLSASCAKRDALSKFGRIES